jgi:hypothetical protein
VPFCVPRMFVSLFLEQLGDSASLYEAARDIG